MKIFFTALEKVYLLINKEHHYKKRAYNLRPHNLLKIFQAQLIVRMKSKAELI